jgi:hypothetical protein
VSEEKTAVPTDGLIYGQTNRGFDILEFLDLYEVPCSLQKSSLATEDAIWFGRNDASPRQLVPNKGWTPIEMPANYCADTRMHLTQDQVRALLPALQYFANTGDIVCRTCGGEGAVGSPTNAEPCPECSYGSELVEPERSWFQRGYEAARAQPMQASIEVIERRVANLLRRQGETFDQIVARRRARIDAAQARGETPPFDPAPGCGWYFDPLWLDADDDSPLPAAGAAPAGWKLVPVEPTEDMVLDGLNSRPDRFFQEDNYPSEFDEMSGCQQAVFKVRRGYAAMLAAAPVPPTQAQQQAGALTAPDTCWCSTCAKDSGQTLVTRMVLCPTCGNKRCPHANDHRNTCTGSNEPGQPGSSYPAPGASS